MAWDDNFLIMENTIPMIKETIKNIGFFWSTVHCSNQLSTTFNSQIIGHNTKSQLWAKWKSHEWELCVYNQPTKILVG